MAIDAPRMKQALEDCSEALEALRDLLQAEQDCLKARQVEGFDALLARKLDALQQVERRDAERRRLLAAVGLDADGTGMRAYLDGCGEPTLQESWSRLTGALSEVRTLNDFNGALIGKSLDQVERNLTLLLGEARRTASTYDTSGRHRMDSKGKEISRA